MHNKCTYKKTSWGAYQCWICYEFSHVQEKKKTKGENNES